MSGIFSKSVQNYVPRFPTFLCLQLYTVQILDADWPIHFYAFLYPTNHKMDMGIKIHVKNRILLSASSLIRISVVGGYAVGSWEVYIFTQIVLLMVKEPSDVVYNFFQVEDISDFS